MAATAQRRYRPSIALMRVVRLVSRGARFALQRAQGSASVPESLRRVPPEAFHGAGWLLRVDSCSGPREADHDLADSPNEDWTPKGA